MSFQREDRTIKRERKSISIPKNRRRRQKKQKQSGNAIYEYVKQGESKCSVSDGMGKIGVLINFDNDSSKIDDIGKNICMHIAATSPKSLSVDDLDKSIVESEREIILKQLKDTGKPDNILEKMMQGKLNKFYEENTLMGQKFVIDPSISVEQYLTKASKEINTQINIQEFLRFEIGS